MPKYYTHVSYYACIIHTICVILIIQGSTFESIFMLHNINAVIQSIYIMHMYMDPVIVI